MLHVALYEPEIPPNTGNIIRLCANAGATLHLIHPLGFSLEEKQLRRAGLDYSEWTTVLEYVNYQTFLKENPHFRLIACTTHAKQAHSAIAYQPEDCLLFGPESRGLPTDCKASIPASQQIRIPMHANSRSLNLSNACAIILYEGMRQLGFPNLM